MDLRLQLSRIRLLSQQLISPQHSDPHDLVAHMGMVQAQDLHGLPRAITIRLARSSPSAFRRAYNEGRIVRSHLFRSTWQLVPAEDLRWMASLCADRNRKAVHGFVRSLGLGITEDDFLRFNDEVAHLLAGVASMPKDELQRRINERGIKADRHHMVMYTRRAEADALICSGLWDDRQSTFALVDQRIPPTTAQPSRIEALTELARRYFRSHSPATADDLTWWTALPKRECQAAIERLSPELSTTTHDGRTFFVHHDCRQGGGGHMRTLRLPAYDEYLIGYKTRDIAVDDQHRALAYNNFGIFYPVVVSQGQVVGRWKEGD